MREDMFKVIVERPRTGRSWAKKTKLRYLNEDDSRTRISGKRLAAECGSRKWLNENLAPLKRYLFKQRGRKWDDVFSEICAQLDTGSTVKMHVREHLDDFIIRNVQIGEGGMYYDMDDLSYRSTPEHWWSDLYVDPESGLICETTELCRLLGLRRHKHDYNKRKKRKRTYRNSFRRLNDTTFLVVCEGIWYRFETTAPPVTMNGFSLSDGVIRNDLRRFRSIVHPLWELKSKKQLSKKELKKHGLKNGGDFE